MTLKKKKRTIIREEGDIHRHLYIIISDLGYFRFTLIESGFDNSLGETFQCCFFPILGCKLSMLNKNFKNKNGEKNNES